MPGQPLQFLMNTRRNPTNVRGLRQALIFSTNRNAIANETGQRIAPVAWGPLAESTLFAYSALRRLYAQDRAQAEALLADAGYQDEDGDGWLEHGDVPLQLDLLVPPRNSLPQVAELLSEQWRLLGIRSKLIPVPTDAAMQQAIREGEYNLVAVSTQGLDPAWLVDYFSTDGPFNWSRFSDDELDGVLNDALVSTEEQIRFSLYARAQQIIMDHALILPLREQVNIVAVDNRLEGLAWDASGQVPLLHNLAWVSQSVEIVVASTRTAPAARKARDTDDSVVSLTSAIMLPPRPAPESLAPPAPASLAASTSLSSSSEETSSSRSNS